MNPLVRAQNAKAAATKRIMRDLKELDKTPIPGLGVTCPDPHDPFVLHCNVLINDGPYKGVLIHLILRIPEDYPLTGPAGNIAPGLEFDSQYHAHIHEDHRNGHALCNDLLTNYGTFFRMIDGGNIKQATGWSPGYTLSTALVQIVTFFADPDYSRPPSEELIKKLHKMVKKYECPICKHTNRQPNPPIVPYDDVKSSEQTEEERKKQEALKLRRELTEKLTCGVTKQNLFDDKVCLGYPLLISRDGRGRLWSNLVLELISYEAYIGEIQKFGHEKLDFYEQAKFRSVTGKDYNHWLPIFINLNHFEQGRRIIENSISIISTGSALANRQNEFTPLMALSVLTSLMNKSSVQLFNGELHESKHAIEAYCHFLRLLMHFIDIYPELERRIDDKIRKFISNETNRDKRNIPDIGEFLIQIALSRNYKIEQMKEALYAEYFARQIFWVQRDQGENFLRQFKADDLLTMFRQTRVSNQLLVFNLSMQETFIFPGVKERLDELYGYPPDHIVENFQAHVKKIKKLDRYSDLIKAIRFSDRIQSPDDMVQWIKDAIKMSDRQKYTHIFSIAAPSFRNPHDNRR